jgi:hypothetical protein
LKINYSCFRKIRSHYFVIIVLKLEIQCAVNQFESKISEIRVI